MNAPLPDFRQAFLAFALERGVLTFGSFTTKSGRNTPYFFNSGLFNDGESLRRLGDFYADAFLASGIACDQLFGPAYTGIPLVSATAVALDDLFPFMRGRPGLAQHLPGIERYREAYGVH